MKTPNFFIIGAPKCGTTSLAAWLSEHPQVFFSSEKEPHHFNTDQAWVLTPKRKDYEKYFTDAGSQHRAVGEGSVWYLYSKLAVPQIEQYCPEARYIVCLRNPVEMAYSLHEQQVVTGNEHIKDFAQAWKLSNARLNGEKISRWCTEPSHLAYGTACKLGEQLQRMHAIVPRDRVLPVLLDDVKENPRRVYLDILRFLALEDDGKSEFKVENTAKELRSASLRKFVLVMGWIKRMLGIRSGLGILQAIDRNNLTFRARKKMDPQLKRDLENHFSQDIVLLETLLNRDLSAWTSTGLN